MARTKSLYICQKCGYQTSKWLGKCPECNAWNSFTEQVTESGNRYQFNQKNHHPSYSPQVLKLKEVQTNKLDRIATGIKEFDRVLGGGLVPASAILFSGEPGIGKSTFLLQVCNNLVSHKRILYVSGEESPEQVKSRAERLKMKSNEDFYFLASVNLMEIDQVLEKVQPDIVIIDSIQTIYHPDMESAPGNVSQVKECSSFLFRKAKENNFILILVGHVTKDGAIAGPKVLEHLVDVVLHFEGNHRDDLRLLRTQKNRFGNTFEMGVFRMTSSGLEEITDTAKFFLDKPEFDFSGTAITAVYENRVLLLEVQALVSKTPFGMPQRTVMGFDHRRLSLIIAILEKRLGLMLKNSDIFIKILGGLRIDDPAVDMAVIMAILSSYYDFIIPHDSLFIGEVGLGGEFRPIPHLEQRLEEARRMQFTNVYFPSIHKIKKKYSNLYLKPVRSTMELMQHFRDQIVKKNNN